MLKRKKFLSVVVALILVTVFGFSACGNTSNSSTQSPATGSGSDVVSSDEVFELKVNYFGSSTNGNGRALHEACVQMEERSEGRIKPQEFYDGTFVSNTDTLQSTANGVVDISYISPSHIPTMFTLNDVFTLPSTEIPASRAAGAKAYRELIEIEPALQEEMAAKNLTWVTITPLEGYHYHGAKKEVRVPADVKGMKLETTGQTITYLTDLGVSAMTLPAGDFYTSLERSMVDGGFWTWPIISSYGLEELTEQHTLFGKGGLWAPASGYVMNLDSYNKLPDDLKQIVKESFSYAMDILIEEDAKTSEEAYSAAILAGHNIVELSDAECAPWFDEMTANNEKWFATAEAAGFDGKGVYETLMELHKKYK
jgi:TRAP-type C4-dicarboxylate transport system substrate-binding protein